MQQDRDGRWRRIPVNHPCRTRAASRGPRAAAPFAQLAEVLEQRRRARAVRLLCSPPVPRATLRQTPSPAAGFPPKQRCALLIPAPKLRPAAAAEQESFSFSYSVLELGFTWATWAE